MKYHLVGDQGVSMKAIKQILLQSGHKVTGSDLKTSGHDSKNITPDIECVVRSSAISPGSPGWVEIEEANRLGINVLKRSQLLGQITSDKYLIAISGMHGKTTVTALVGLILIEAGLDPTVLVGETLSEFDNTAYKIGKSKYFVLEACEYDRSFLDLNPSVAVITNIDLEHLDTYPGGMNEIKKAFSGFISKIKKSGAIIASAQDKNLLEIVSKADPSYKKIYYGGEKSEQKVDYPMALFGRHNILNGQAALALADYLKIDMKYVLRVLNNFKGAKRRLEYKGNFGQVLVFDDYGHHPTEIATTIQALKDKFPDKKIITVFWPHQYKRIFPLKDKFINAFSQADDVILKPIYLVPGRDEKLDISSEQISDGINKINSKSQVIDEDVKIIEYLKKFENDNAVILTIGIPPIYKVADILVKKAK